MDNSVLTKIPVAEAGMLIRRPVSVVYEAFIDPQVTTHFWFTKSDGRLEAGKRLRWEWVMYGISTLVDVLLLEPCERIEVDWDVDNVPTRVTLTFTSHSPDTTFVSITNSGFTGNADQVVHQAMDSAAGFAMVLAGAKAYLEYGIELQLIADRLPDLHTGDNQARMQEE